MKMSFLKLHPFSIFFLVIAFFTGYFKPVIYLMTLLFIHEIGHASAGIYFGWHLQKIILLPFGGLTVFQEYLNRPIYEEAIILFAGPFYQILTYHLLCLLGFQTEMLTSIHAFLLIFNFLPIYPLDGSKAILLLLQKNFAFEKSNFLLAIISFVGTAIVFCIFKSNLLLLCSLFFLLGKTIKFWNRRKEIFYHFLLERHLHFFSFHKEKKITTVHQMKRDYHHWILKDHQYIREEEYFRKIFDFTRLL